MIKEKYANFYDKNDKCLYSVKIRSESEGDKLSDYLYAVDERIKDWSITLGRPVGKVHIV